MFIEVQFSVYPLREAQLSPVIEKAVSIFKDFDLPVEVGSMSSVTYGDTEIVFKAFQKVYEEVALNSHVTCCYFNDSLECLPCACERIATCGKFCRR
jgi:uncharacterized protein YqgV (UPF0045/DUF77 family)